MSRKQVTISETGFTCPITGKTCRVGITLKFRPDDVVQMPLLDDDQADAVQGALVEADRDG